jgi:hypothetical protein
MCLEYESPTKTDGVHDVIDSLFNIDKVAASFINAL